VGESYLSPCYNPPIPHSFPLESEAFCVMCDRNFIYNDEYVISEMIGGTVLEGFELSGWTGLALTVEGYADDDAGYWPLFAMWLLGIITGIGAVVGGAAAVGYKIYKTR